MDGWFCVDTLAERWSNGQLLIEGPCTVFEIAKAYQNLLIPILFGLRFDMGWELS